MEKIGGNENERKERKSRQQEHSYFVNGTRI